LLRWDANDEFNSYSRHKDNINTMSPVGEHIWYTSESDVFRINSEKVVERIESSHKNKCDVLTCNSAAVFTQCNDKILIRYEDGKEVQKATMP